VNSWLTPSLQFACKSSSNSHHTAQLLVLLYHKITICPKNWRLPRSDNPGSSPGGNNNLNEFWNLNQNSGANATALHTNWLGVRAGFVGSDGNFGSVGAWGGYWSSTVSDAAGALILGFSATGVTPAGSCSKAQGCSVRCVLD